MKKLLKDMSMTELKDEIFMLRVLESSLERCMQDDPGFTDDNAVILLHETKDALNDAWKEEYKRRARAIPNCS